MRTLHVISHTHWDREWYLTFQQFRLKLVNLVDSLLDILDKDPQFKHFMLDGQTIVLDDYLLMRPEKEQVLREYIRSKRIIIGPWHILPDMFLVGPEAHIRNLLEGWRTTGKFGSRMMVGYMPDSFGHIGQMPQILRGFGIETACLWRGLDDEPAELWWQSPDGSQVLLAYLRDSYSNGAMLPGGESAPNPGYPDAIASVGQSLAEHSASTDLLIMFGTDHMQPARNTSANIVYANQVLKDTRVIHSTIEQYFTAIQPIARENQLPLIEGELRNSEHIYLLPGVLSTRMWIKQRNQASENLLTRWVEPFSIFADLERSKIPPGDPLPAGFSDQTGIIRQAWRLLMENHPHDSICGCSIDQVHSEMVSRFDQVDQIGEELTHQNLEMLANRVSAPSNIGAAQALGTVIVFNAGPFVRSDLASVDLKLPHGTTGFTLRDENGQELPFETLGLGGQELINVRMGPAEFQSAYSQVHDGLINKMGIRAFELQREGSLVLLSVVLGHGEPDASVWKKAVNETTSLFSDQTISGYHIRAHTSDEVRVIFTAHDIPALGWRAFTVQAKNVESAPVSLPPLAKMLLPLVGRLANVPAGQVLINRLQAGNRDKTPESIENEFFKVEVDQSGTLTVHDKRDGFVYHGLNRFEDSGDCGDEYNFSPPPVDNRQVARLKRITGHKGLICQVFNLELTLKVPDGLVQDRKTRSQKQVELPIASTITLTRGVPRIDIHSRVENHARDHRLRVHFPTPLKSESANYDGHFEVVNRRIGIPDFDPQKWAEEPRPETHQRAFTEVAGPAGNFTLANRGLPEVEVLNTTDGSEIALTLLRCVGWLSRDDFTTRRGHAGPKLETPAAQMPGCWEFDYAIIPSSVEAQTQSRAEAYGFGSPLRAIATPVNKTGTLPVSGSIINVEASDAIHNGGKSRFVISAVKQCDQGDGWLVRGYNSGHEELELAITPFFQAEQVALVNLAEQKIATLGIDPVSGRISTTVKAFQIVTIWFGSGQPVASA